MRRQRVARGTAVKIVWVDSVSVGGWQYNLDHVGRIAPITTFGLVVNTKDDCITLTTSMGERGGALDPVSIPWGAINELEIVEER